MPAPPHGSPLWDVPTTAREGRLGHERPDGLLPVATVGKSSAPLERVARGEVAGPQPRPARCQRVRDRHDDPAAPGVLRDVPLLVVEQDGVFHMFYTGVSTIPDTCYNWQRTGLATSTDLMEWQRLDAPIHACTMVPWTVCDSLAYSTAFRDPFVMPDPAHPGGWLMYYSTFPAADSGGMVVGMATSDGDLHEWSDLGPLWITNRTYSYHDIIESSHLFEHDGLWYLFFTTNSGQPLSFATGSDPVGGPETWVYRGQLATMLGVNTEAWYASEHFRDGLVDYFAFVTGDRIDIQRIEWGEPGYFTLVQPPVMHVTGMAWDRDSTREDSTATLAFAAVNGTVEPALLEALRVLSDGRQVPVSLDSLGLPGTVTLTGDTTRVAWRAVWLPEPADTTLAVGLVGRLTDQTAAAPVLTVTRAPSLPDSLVEVRVPDAGPALWLEGARPTPSRGALWVGFALPSGEPAVLELMDVAGRVVERRPVGGAGAGRRVVRLGADGALPGGLYFLRLSQGAPAGCTATVGQCDKDLADLQRLNEAFGGQMTAGNANEGMGVGYAATVHLSCAKT